MRTELRAGASRRTGLSLAVAAACMCAAGARAENIDVNNVIKGRLAGKMAAIYQAKVGKPMPANATSAVSFKGSIVHQGINFTMPNTIPQAPKILQQNTLSNCNDRESSQHVTVNKTTTQTESWSTTDTVSAEVSVTVSYDSPIGVGVEGSATAGYSKEWNKGGEKSEALTWETGAEVPVGPGKQVKVQFVVDEQKLDIPYRVDFVASGATYITFTDPAQGSNANVTWTSSKSANAVAGGKESNGTQLYICRGSYKGGVHAGKVVAGYCNIGYGGKEEKLSSYQWLSADASGIEWVNNVGTRAISAGTENGQERYVCRVSAHGGVHPGKVVSGKCNYGYGGKEEISGTFQALNTKAAAGAQTHPVQVNLEDYLSSAERTITLRGVYRGVAAVQGDFRVDTPKTLECAAQLQIASARAVQAPPGTAAATAAPRSAAAARAVPPPVQAASAQEIQASAVLPKSASISKQAVKPKPARGK